MDTPLSFPERVAAFLLPVDPGGDTKQRFILPDARRIILVLVAASLLGFAVNPAAGLAWWLRALMGLAGVCGAGVLVLTVVGYRRLRARAARRRDDTGTGDGPGDGP